MSMTLVWPVNHIRLVFDVHFCLLHNPVRSRCHVACVYLACTLYSLLSMVNPLRSVERLI
jgi:hypothetical protein